MVYQKITVKMVVGFRGSRPMPFHRWVTVLGCQAVNQRPCHTRESVVPGELAGQLSRQELNVEPHIWIDGLPMFTNVYHPLMVKLGLVDPIILPTLSDFIII